MATKLYFEALSTFDQFRVRIGKDTRGQDLLEYALFAGLIAVVAAASIPSAVTSVGVCFSRVVASLNGLAGGLNGG